MNELEKVVVSQAIEISRLREKLEAAESSSKIWYEECRRLEAQKPVPEAAKEAG